MNNTTYTLSGAMNNAFKLKQFIHENQIKYDTSTYCTMADIAVYFNCEISDLSLVPSGIDVEPYNKTKERLSKNREDGFLYINKSNNK